MKEMVNFNLQAFIDAANELVRADEVANALWLLEKGIPAWYRDHPPQEVLDLKHEIYKRIATPSFYATDAGSELDTHPNVHLLMKQSLRGDIVAKEVRHLNSLKYRPGFYDFGPGEFWTPKLLISENLLFDYQPVWVNHPSYKHYLKDFESVLNKPSPAEPKIFWACEIIEHMWKEDELRYEMQRNIGMADLIHFSTPAYTFDTECVDWKASKKDLGHLRAYTPMEFFLTITKLFPEYDLTLFGHKDIHLHVRGVLRTTKFQDIKSATIETIFK